jgi:hypothetical protein
MIYLLLEIFHYPFMRIAEIYINLEDGLLKLLDLYITNKNRYILKEYDSEIHKKELGILSEKIIYYYFENYTLKKNRGNIILHDCKLFQERYNFITKLSSLNKKNIIDIYILPYSKINNKIFYNTIGKLKSKKKLIKKIYIKNRII